jgi:parallel beta-helix repeat protein
MVENNCHYNTVNNNIAIGNDADGIQLYTSNYCTVIGNIVMNNGLRPAYGFDGIRLYNSSNNIINGNMAYDNQGSPTQDWGIKELGSSDWNIIIGNSCLTNQINGILQIGTNTKVNLCYNSTNWIA